MGPDSFPGVSAANSSVSTYLLLHKPSEVLNHNAGWHAGETLRWRPIRQHPKFEFKPVFDKCYLNFQFSIIKKAPAKCVRLDDSCTRKFAVGACSIVCCNCWKSTRSEREREREREIQNELVVSDYATPVHSCKEA